MNLVDTTGVFEDASHLRLARPIQGINKGPVRVLLMFEDGPDPIGAHPKHVDFRAAIGSFHRDYPDEPVRTSGQWLKELREGE